MTFVCNLCLLPCSLHFECYVSITQSVTLKKLMAQRHKLHVRRHRNLCDIENASQHTYHVMCNAATEVSYRCDKSFELIIICLLTHPKKCYTFFEKETICVHRNNPLILSSNALLHKWYILIFISRALSCYYIIKF